MIIMTDNKFDKESEPSVNTDSLRRICSLSVHKVDEQSPPKIEWISVLYKLHFNIQNLANNYV